MKTMPNTEISHAELEMMFNSPFKEGGESVILKGPTRNSLYKVFIDHTNEESFDYYGNPLFSSITDMLDNKFEKIKRLYAMQLDDSVHPISSLTSEGRLIGYEMTRDIGDKQLNGINISRQETIYYLEQAKKILEYYASKDITYGDVASRNILINRSTAKVKFCDMDNIRLGEFPIDLITQELEHYDFVRGMDEHADTYMHNLLTIQQLANCDSYERILTAISHKRYPKGFKMPARNIMKSMVSPEMFTGESIIQYVKK